MLHEMLQSSFKHQNIWQNKRQSTICSVAVQESENVGENVKWQSGPGFVEMLMVQVCAGFLG